MNFQVSFSGSPTTIKIINAPSWSSCLAYCEGTGLVVNSISLMSTQIIVNDESTTNCYSVSLISNTTNLPSTYCVFDTDYNSLQNWINSQTEKSVKAIILNQQSYVVV